MYKTSKELFRSEYVSYSRLSSYEKCPRQFKLRYLDGIPCPVGKAAQLGSVVHEIIARYLKDIGFPKSAIQTDIYDLCKLIIPTCKELRETGKITFFLQESEIEYLLNGFVKLLPKFDSRSIVSVEAERNFKVGKYKFKTITDLILRNDKGKLTVIDFKTGKPEYVDDSQIQMYAIPLFDEASTSEIELIYAFLKHGELKRLKMTRGSVKTLANGFITRVQCIEDDNTFFPESSFLCRYCGVRDHCPES